MKKFFYSLVVVCFSFVTADAQITDQQKAFIAYRFSEHMSDHVMQDAKIFIVTEKYSNRQKRKKIIFQYIDLAKGVVYQEPVRIGDTLGVFNNQPFYSRGKGLWMYPISVKKKRTKAQRAPKSPEQKAQNAQLIGSLFTVGMGILSQTTGISGGRNGYYH